MTDEKLTKQISALIDKATALDRIIRVVHLSIDGMKPRDRISQSDIEAVSMLLVDLHNAEQSLSAGLSQIANELNNAVEVERQHEQATVTH